MKEVVLFISHIVNDETIKRFRKLNKDLSCRCEVYWAYHQVQDIPYFPQDIKTYIFNFDKLRELGYSPLYRNTIYTNVNYILQRFYKDYPQYERYWSIEYDVVFTGNWDLLISTLENYDADLISCHIEKYSADNNGDWYWWKPLFLVDCNIPIENCVKAFNPIYALSNRALNFLDDFLRKRNCAHFETLISTALYNNSFKLVDMGGIGSFTPPELRNKFYVQGVGVNNGTMRFRPVFLEEEVDALCVSDKLFHPLKI
jgi:hypothetical protein